MITQPSSPQQPQPLLGGMSAEYFFRHYWHKKPLLIRQAIPAFQAPVTRDELFVLAQQPQVESRLIQQQRGKWHLQPGPFASTALPSRKQRHWTLLVQGVNLHHALADQLLQQFRFIPDTRLDDLMISVASDGGGVGPHFDSYDVFLLQAAGQRQWDISMQDNLDLVEGVPLKILKHFKPEQRWVLEPGDMLYLPPQVAHDGIALGECMTWSIGFRAPDYQEIGQAFLEYLADTIDLPGRYADPRRSANPHPAWIDDSWITAVEQALKRIAWSKTTLRNFLGEYLSTPKPTTFFAPPAAPLSLTQFRRQLSQAQIVLNARTRMLYRTPELFVNGESFTVTHQEAALLKKLANQRTLNAHQILSSEVLIETFYGWYRAGWIGLRTGAVG